MNNNFAAAMHAAAVRFAAADGVTGGGRGESRDGKKKDPEPKCETDPQRSEAVQGNPNDPSNLAPGVYPSITTQISASAPVTGLLAIGVGGESRSLADFGTGTVHQFTTFSVVLGPDWGGSVQFSGGAGNRNYTDVYSDGSALTGFSVSGSLDLVFGAGGGLNSNLYPTSSYSSTTTTIGVGADIGVSVLPSWSNYEGATSFSDLPQDLQQFYLDAWNRECGSGAQ